MRVARHIALGAAAVGILQASTAPGLPCAAVSIAIATVTEGRVVTGTMLAAHRAGPRHFTDAQRLTFEGVAGRDVYNPTKPILVNGKTILAARVESRHSETDTQVFFFEEHGGSWRPIEGVLPLKLQDPFFSIIAGELIGGGVETFPEPGGGLGYRTVFLRGKDPASLTRFAVGPAKMKDIRLVALSDGRLGLFTRPQGKIEGTDIDGERGRIGFRIVDKVADLTPELMRTAPLIKAAFEGSEWLGANEVVALEDGRLGVLGHIARFDTDGSRHYYPVAFFVEPATGVATGFKVLLERADLPGGLEGASKRDDLRDVLFSGGLDRHADGTATLYVGAGDAEVYRIRIPDPFVTEP